MWHCFTSHSARLCAFYHRSQFNICARSHHQLKIAESPIIIAWFIGHYLGQQLNGTCWRHRRTRKIEQTRNNFAIEKLLFHSNSHGKKRFVVQSRNDWWASRYKRLIYLCRTREKKCIDTIKFVRCFFFKSKSVPLDERSCVCACGLWLRFDLWLAKHSQFRSQWILYYIYRTQTKFRNFPMPIRAHARTHATTTATANNHTRTQIIYLTFISFWANYMNKNLERNFSANILNGIFAAAVVVISFFIPCSLRLSARVWNVCWFQTENFISPSCNT